MDMEGFDKQLRKILEGYANFLREKELAVSKHQPHLVRWVREFLVFAREHAGSTFEQTLDLFLATVGGGVWARSPGNCSRRRTPYASTATSIVEQARSATPTGKAWCSPTGWRCWNGYAR
jgi:hypothetical protein